MYYYCYYYHIYLYIYYVILYYITLYSIATRIPPTPIGGLDAWRLRGFDAWKDWKATVLGKALLSWNPLGNLLQLGGLETRWLDFICFTEAWQCEES